MTNQQRAPKREREKGPGDTDRHYQDASLISNLEHILAACKAKNNDDMAVAAAVQTSLTSHQMQPQTFYPRRFQRQ